MFGFAIKTPIEGREYKLDEKDLEKVLVDLRSLSPYVEFARDYTPIPYDLVLDELQGLSAQIRKGKLRIDIVFSEHYKESPLCDEDFFEFYVNASARQKAEIDCFLEFESNRPHDSFVGHLSYDHQGYITLAKLYIWHLNLCHTIFFGRTKAKGFHVKKIANRHINDEKEIVLYRA